MKKIINLALAAIPLWFILSWVDIISHNSFLGDPNYAQYQAWNLFIILEEVFGV